MVSWAKMTFGNTSAVTKSLFKIVFKNRPIKLSYSPFVELCVASTSPAGHSHPVARVQQASTVPKAERPTWASVRAGRPRPALTNLLLGAQLPFSLVGHQRNSRGRTSLTARRPPIDRHDAVDPFAQCRRAECRCARAIQASGSQRGVACHESHRSRRIPSTRYCDRCRERDCVAGCRRVDLRLEGSGSRRLG